MLEKSSFTHVASIYTNLLEQKLKKAFKLHKSSTPRGLIWDTNMAAVSLFWDTNMVAVTSCENTLHCNLLLDNPGIIFLIKLCLLIKQ